jgi:chemotaxis protein MotA
MNFLSIFVGFAILSWGAWASVEDLRPFINVHALLIVFGGTLVATIMAFRFTYLLRFVPSVMFNIFLHGKIDRKHTVKELTKLNDAYRTRSMVIGEMINKSRDGFLRESMALLLEGIIPPEKVLHILETRARWVHERELNDSKRVKTVGHFVWMSSCLAFLIGTMSVLTHPPLLEGWGPSLNGMSPLDMLPYFVPSISALVYGLVLRSLVLHPIASNLELVANERLVKNRVISHGVGLMAQQVNPLHFTEELNSYLSPYERVEWKAA